MWLLVPLVCWVNFTKAVDACMVSGMQGVSYMELLEIETQGEKSTIILVLL